MGCTSSLVSFSLQADIACTQTRRCAIMGKVVHVLRGDEVAGETSMVVFLAGEFGSLSANDHEVPPGPPSCVRVLVTSQLSPHEADLCKVRWSLHAVSLNMKRSALFLHLSDVHSSQRLS
jgi:hypothetical protein